MGAWIDHLQPVCAPWDAANNRLGPVNAGDNFGNVNGGNPTLTRAICAPGYAVSRIDYGMTFPDGPPGHVQNLDVTCAMVQNLNAVDSWHPQMLSDNGKRDTGRWCATPGTIANSMVIGLDGVNITDIHHYCDTPANIMAAAQPAQGASAPAAGTGTPLYNHFSADVRQTRLGASTNQAPGAAPVPGDSIIEGDWQTSEGPMSLTQNGNRLDGSYSKNGGSITARNMGNSWTGFWTQSTSGQRCSRARQGSDYWGQMEFVFSDQNRHFDGTWSYCQVSPTGGSKWTGDRIK